MNKLLTRTFKKNVLLHIRNDSPGEGSVKGLSRGFLAFDPLLLGLQQPVPTQVFPMIFISKLVNYFLHDLKKNQTTYFLAAQQFSSVRILIR